MNETQAIRDELSELTSAPYETVNVPPDYPLGGDDVLWFIRSFQDPSYAKQTEHASVAWKNGHDQVRLESNAVGNSLELIEQAYGEEVAEKAIEMNMSDFDSPQVRKEFGKGFPRVIDRLNLYENVISNLSKTLQVRLELLYHGSKGIVTFRLVATIETKGLTLETVLEAVKKNVEALRLAYDEIVEYSKQS